MSLQEAKQVPIGWFEDDGLTPVTPETRQAVRDAAASLERHGFQVKPFRPSMLEAARKAWHVFFVQCGAMFHAHTAAEHMDKLSPTFCNFLDLAHANPPLTAESLLHMWSYSDSIRGQFLAETQQFPLLLMPVSAIPAFRHGERTWTVEGRKLHYLDAMRYTQWFNLLAAPAAVIPVGRSPEGLPIGVQIAGRPYNDEMVLAVAAAVDREFGYRPPPLASA
jgi:Asp-tRNA(Asn)/Glu-tRNA(Gln) amidotransferase A subunit family amidase